MRWTMHGVNDNPVLSRCARCLVEHKQVNSQQLELFADGAYGVCPHCGSREVLIKWPIDNA